MEKLVVFIVLLLVNQCQFFPKGLPESKQILHPLNQPPDPGWQCWNDCRIGQQEDCNPGCFCEGTNPPIGFCMWDGHPPPTFCSTDHDCTEEVATSYCIKANDSEHGLCHP
ncbi:hypothetical protein LIER_36846 [Lithospermum erythrorhizon]|uniref:Secreted protein n=1 Tax=Lithospermum erythrorhizon TaxID=34254 RepID=A0AAV3PBH4_LITER